MKILLGDFNAKVGREEIVKSTFGNESLQEIEKSHSQKYIVPTSQHPQI
jgi:hypothetical protein